jgi:hypothetical protein
MSIQNYCQSEIISTFVSTARLRYKWTEIQKVTFFYFSSQITLRLNMVSFWDGAPCSLVDTDQSSP